MNTAKDYRKEIFNNIRKHVIVNEDIDNIIIAGEYNQYVADKEVQKLHNEIGVKEIHAYVNKINIQQLNKTCKNGSKPIDSIVATSRIMEYVKGCEVINYNDIVETDHRAYIIDINAKDFFK